MDYKKLLKQVLKSSEDGFILTEKLITFGGKAYPKFNNVVILAGGAGSSKGFQINNLIGIEGKIFDVDALKSLALKTPKIIKRIKKELDIDLSNLDLKNPEHVKELHVILSDEMKLGNKSQETTFKSILFSNPKRKPNLIFDVTLKSIDKLRKITFALENLGYMKKNIHIVWVLNSVNVALKQNKKRDRIVPDDIFIQTHEGVSSTMKKLLSDAKGLSEFIDGDFWVSANQAWVDTKSIHSTLPKIKGKTGQYIKEANYWLIKKQGKPAMSLKNFDKDLMDKIKEYTPNVQNW